MAYTANQVAEKYGVKYLGLTASRLPGKSLFSSLDDSLSQAIFNMIDTMPELSEEKRVEISKYIANIQYIQPDYMKNNGLSSVNFMSKILKKRDLTFISETIRQTIVGKNVLFRGKPITEKFSHEFQRGETLVLREKDKKFIQ